MGNAITIRDMVANFREAFDRVYCIHGYKVAGYTPKGSDYVLLLKPLREGGRLKEDRRLYAAGDRVVTSIPLAAYRRRCQ